MREEIKLLISKAKRSLKTAQRLCEDGDKEFVKTGIFDSKYHRYLISTLRRDRPAIMTIPLRYPKRPLRRF